MSESDKEIEARLKKEEEQGWYEVPKEELPAGVSYRKVYGKRPPKPFGEAPAVNTIIPLVE